MGFVVEIDGHFIGPFAKEAEAKERVRQELTAWKGKGIEAANLHFVLPPHWVKPGGPYNVPFVIIKADGTEHYPYGKHGDGWPGWPDPELLESPS